MTDTNGQCLKSVDSFSIRCGKDEIELRLNKRADIVDAVADKKPMTEDEVFKVLEEDAVYSYGLSEVIEAAEKILILLPDSTRKSGAEVILPKFVAEIEEQGKEFHFIIAVGTHRPATEDELKAILTPDIYRKHSDKLIEHNSEDYDNMDFYGVTKRKTTVLMNKAYREHDTVITIGSVSYHYFAGYGGGRKLIMPGIGGKKSIMANHKLALDPVNRCRHEKAVTGNMKQNPVHDDIVDAIMISRSSHTFFAVNTLLDNSGQIVDVTCGDLFMSHIKAAELLDEQAAVEAGRYDLVYLSAGGFPKDINMVQAQKSLDRIVPLLADGAKVVFFAECRDGYGNSFFEEFFNIETADEMLNELMGDYQINRQTAYNLKTRLEAFDVYLYSNFSDEDCRRMGFKRLSSVGEAESLADDAERVGFAPFAYNILPR